MKSLKYKATNFLLHSICMVIVWTAFSCHNHTEEDGHEHTVEKVASSVSEKAEPAHSDEEPMIVALTEEQINTVGIALGAVEVKQLTSTVKVNGLLSVPNDNKANITSLHAGVVRYMKVQVGSAVAKGQIVAILENAEMIKLQQEYLELISAGGSAEGTATYSNSQYATLNLEKQSLQPQIDYAQKEYSRQKELFDGNAGARKNLELAGSNLKALQQKQLMITEQLATLRKASNSVASSRLAGVRAQLQNMGINPANVTAKNITTTLVVKSPISGTISNVLAKIGSYIDVSSPVAEVVNNNSLHLDLQVFEKDLPRLRVGQVIHFTLTNNPAQEYDAEIYSIGSAFENSSKTIPVHCRVNGNKSGLIDGMNISALVSLNNYTTPAVPNDAIVEADGKFYIFMQTSEQLEDHHDDEAHSHDAQQPPSDKEGTAAAQKSINFEKVEVVKGVSELGYTAITPVVTLPQNCRIAVKGAFFINAKLTNTEGHSH
jgi:membrane fusion protein, heavy metal efflux system